MKGLRAFLERTALDPGFRELVREDLGAALAGYSLSDEERAAVEGGGDALLALLGRVLRADGEAGGNPAPAPVGEGLVPSLRSESDSDSDSDSESESDSDSESPTVAFLLHVSPQRIETDQGPAIAWQTAVHPLTRPPTPGPEDACLEIGLTPRQLATPDGPRLTYQTSVQPWPRPASSEAAPASASPWDHRLAGDDVAAAVASVRAADPSDRYQRLRELIDAVRSAP